MDLGDVVCECVDWIELAENKFPMVVTCNSILNEFSEQLSDYKLFKQDSPLWI
jgi:hypothetical protein